jgi:hypothetical protein
MLEVKGVSRLGNPGGEQKDRVRFVSEGLRVALLFRSSVAPQRLRMIPIDFTTAGPPTFGNRVYVT